MNKIKKLIQYVQFANIFKNNNNYSYNYHLFKYTITLFLIIISLISCKDQTKPDTFDGIIVLHSKHANYFKAINLAIDKALRKGIIRLIGSNSYNDNKDIIETTFFDQKFNRSRKYTISHEIIARTKRDGVYNVTAKVHLDLDKIKQKLRQLKIPILQTDSNISLDQNEIQDINVLKNETILVYYDKNKLKIPIELADIIVQRINHILANFQLNYIELDQITRLNKDTNLIEKSSRGMALLQLIAKKLHADIYIEVNGHLDDGNYENETFQSNGGILLSAYESSTARGLGNEETSLKKKGDSLKSVQKKILLSSASPAIHKLLKSIIKYKSQPQIYYITLYGEISYHIKRDFLRALQKDNEITSIQLTEVTNKSIKYIIKYKGFTHHLISKIFRRLKEREGFEGLFIKLLRRKEVILSL